MLSGREHIAFPVEGVDRGSISMFAVRVESGVVDPAKPPAKP